MEISVAAASLKTGFATWSDEVTGSANVTICSRAAAVAMRRRYASATAEAKNATAPTDEDRAAQDGEQASDAASRSDVNGRVTMPGT